MTRQLGRRKHLACMLLALGIAACRDFALVSGGATGGQGASTSGGTSSEGGRPEHDASSGMTSGVSGSSSGAEAGAGGGGGGGDPGPIGGSGFGGAAGGGDPGGEPGDAGAPAGSGCRSDTECDDRTACNGAERCDLGTCRAGADVSCPKELVCRERDEEAACEFVDHGPWITFLGPGSAPGVSMVGLYGVPARYANRLPPIELTQAAIDEDYQVVWDHRWSTNGRHLLINVAGERRALYSIEFGDGLPSPARAIPNLPRDQGQYSIGPFSPWVDCALAQERRLLFDICFGPSGPVVQLIHEDMDDLNLDTARYCSGAKAALVSSRLLALDATEPASESLPGFVVSPDGARLLGATEAGLELRPCALGSTGTPLELPVVLGEGAVAWAPDSRHAMVHEEWDAEELMLIDVDSASDVVTWRGAISDPEHYRYTFSANSEYVLIEDGPAFSLVSVVNGARTALPQPGDANGWQWADDGTTLIIRRALDPGRHTAAWWLAAPLTSPRLVFETELEGVELAVSTRAGLALAVSASAQPSIWRIDLNDLAAGPRKLRVSLPIGPLNQATLAVDGSGVLLINPAPSLDNLYWLSLLGDSEGELAWLNKGNSVFGEFQPWP